jgi:AcrR family transcriptional regulator
MDLLASEGMETFTLAKLAEKTESAIGAMYRYFPSKEALLVALQREVLGSFHRELARVLESVEGPLSRLVAATRWYGELPELHPQEWGLLAVAVGSPRVLLPGDDAARVLEAAEPLFSILTELISAATSAGELGKGNARTRAIELWAALHGVLQIQKLARLSPALDSRAFAADLVRDLFRGWGAPEDSLKAALRTKRKPK